MKVEEIKLSDIKLANNSRIDIKQGELLTLMNSIREKGLLQPIGVRKNPRLQAKK